MGSNEACRYKEALLGETREELAKADAKASILLAATGVAFGALLTAIGNGAWAPGRVQHGDARLTVWISMAFALIGIFLLGSAVKPRLRSRAMGREQLHYFGNVRSYWPSVALWNRRSRLDEGRTAFDEALKLAANDANYEARLDDQLWFLGRTAFRKYRLISLGLWMLSGAVILALLALLLERY
jgi:hypothetical protein